MFHFNFDNNCEKCGAQCCKNWNPANFDSSIVDNYGNCIYLDLNTNLCTIYNERPEFCRTDEYYYNNFTNIMSLEQYLQKQKEGCELLKKIAQQKNFFNNF
jgi:Fe-S-cluster containining protein